MKPAAYALTFLVAATAANVVVAHYGPAAALPVAFVLVALAYVTRDALHDYLEGRELAGVMAALVLGGAGLAYLASPDAGRVAAASALAFAAGMTVDAVAYHAARRRPWLERSNASNLAGAAVDSVVFVAVAFPGFLAALAFAQFTAKVAGGLVYSLAVAPLRGRAALRSV